MYNLIIVEDEVNIRKGIENNYDWEKMGLRIIGSLSNGLEAFKFMSWNIVHVALVDIRMPVMDGLELLRQCQMLKMKTHFIFLSAYDSFQYAQNAINYGAEGYLLKPLKELELEEIMTGVLHELNLENKMENIEADETQPDEKALSGIPPFVKKAMFYVNENYDEKHTLESISKMLYVSPTYFGIVFKKSTGMSFVDYLAGIKINKAKDIMASLSCSIKEVAMKVGYDDYSYFCKVFKKYTTYTPLEYRKQILFRS
jgi:two-component system, response regulator YesN